MPLEKSLTKMFGVAAAVAAFFYFPEAGLAQCSARVQTGLGTSAVALAQRCGTTVGDLRRANPGRSLNKPGLLNIPGGRTSAVPESLNNEIAPAPPAIRATRQKPIVRPAPTFKDSSVRGQTPSAATAGFYQIRRGDTLSAIASRSGLSLQALLEANPGVVPTRLSVGQRIRLPAS